MHKRLLVFVAALLVTAVPLAAQAQDKRGMFIIGGGYTAPNSEVSDHLGDGYNFTIGGQVNVKPKFGIEGLYSFNGLGDKQISIPVFDHARRHGRHADRLLRQHEHAVRDGRRRAAGSRAATSGPTASPEWACTTGRSRSRSRRRLRAGLLQSVVLRLLSRRLRRGGEHHRRAQLDGLRHGVRRRHQLRRRLRRASLPLHLGTRPSEERPTIEPIADGDTISDRKANGQFLAVSFGLRF